MLPVLVVSLLASDALAVDDYWRPRFILTGQVTGGVSDSDYSFFGLAGAVDLRLGGFTMGAVLDFSDCLDIPISYVSVVGRLGGYIYVNQYLAIQPYVGFGYDWWYLTGSSSEEGIETSQLSTGVQFIIRPTAGRFLISAGTEIRNHLDQEGEGVLIIQIKLGVGVGLGG